MKKRLLAILCAVALLLPMAVLPSTAATALPPQKWEGEEHWIDYTLKNAPDYSFAVLGDIQFLTARDVDNNTTFTQHLFDWIIDKKDTRNIQYVFGLGDSINTLSSWGEVGESGTVKDGYYTSVHNPAEWKIAGDQFARLSQSGIPYMVVRGNHDDEAGFNSAIATEAYQNQIMEDANGNEIGGFFYDSSKPSKDGNSMSNAYTKLTIGGTKYLMLGLDYNIYENQAVRDWANSVISANPDHTVIVSIHAYIGSSGSLLNQTIGEAGEKSQNPSENVTVSEQFSATQLWNEIFSQHANIAAILCGHVALDVPVVQTRTGDNGNKVIEILVDPQDNDDDRALGNYHTPDPTSIAGDQRCGFVLMLNFSNNGKTIELEYISTIRERGSATYFDNTTKFHLAQFQNDSSRTMKSVDVTLETVVSCTTQEKASTRISNTHSGLRFKTDVAEKDINYLIDTYGKSNVSVGTLIAPTDLLGTKSLTHGIGTPNKDYIDVVATLDKPFASENGTLTYAGTISNIKQKNLGREFTAVGYVAYRTDASAPWTYVYSGSSAVRSINTVASAALKDPNANLGDTPEQIHEARCILEKLTVAYWTNLDKDPGKEDPFYVS